MQIWQIKEISIKVSIKKINKLNSRKISKMLKKCLISEIYGRFKGKYIKGKLKGKYILENFLKYATSSHIIFS